MNMTATDRLRAMLDERGVEWRSESCMSDSENITFWNTDADVAVASQGYDGMLWVSARLTPEQAITATLGAGTCHINELDALTQTLSMANACAWGECSECGCLTPDDSTYCINCGKKVVDE